MTSTVDEKIKAKAKTWQSEQFDEETRQKVKDLLENDPQGLTEAFYKNLEFGTGGLRGIMGVGTNRMNIYTVGMATQGICNYIHSKFPLIRPKVAIAHDSRNNSPLFAQTAADVFSANDFEVHLFRELRPTPELSFAIRHLNCNVGVVITASHNPKEYNGYKVYWSDGGQLVPPHDKNIIAEVNKISSIEEVDYNADQNLIFDVEYRVDQAYLDSLKKLSLSPDMIKRQSDLTIVFTNLHGTGITMVPRCLQAFGFKNIHTVERQDEPDGNFPTVYSPNPEEPAALEMALQKGQRENAELVMGTDPDSDRVGIAVRDLNGEFILLNGNQTGSLLIYYLLTRWHEKLMLDGNQFIAKTIVTTNLMEKIAEKYKVDCYNVLTGFKYIAELIKKFEGKKQFIGGGEESYGYLAGDFVRDKDAILSCALIAELVAWCKDNGKTAYEQLIDIYREFGFYKEKLVSIKKEGKEGAEEIQKMISNFRENPPKELDGGKVVVVKDFQSQEVKKLESGETTDTGLPVSNVLQFKTDRETIVTVRPSGTEPKIKFYFSINDELKDKAEFESKNKELDERLERLKEEVLGY